MVKRKPYQTKLCRSLLYTAWCVAFLTPVMTVTGPHHWVKKGKTASLYFSGNAPAISAPSKQTPETKAIALNQEGVLPNILEPHDIDLYKQVIKAQRASDLQTADAGIGEIKNKLLMGHVLAERYLNRRYHATSEELANWLNQYPDHPQAPEIYAYAIAKNPSAKQDVPLIRRQQALEAYGDDKGMNTHDAENGPFSNAYRAGLAAYKNGQKADAAKLFSEMALHQNMLTPWMTSASAYWAYRSYTAVGNHSEAALYLKMASEHPRSFYGILARKQLNLPLDLDISPVELTDSDVLEMVGDQTIRRVVALSQAGMSDMAEKELRLRFTQADDTEKQRLLALAHELGLASIQISMAKYLGSDGHELDFARFPIPNLQPAGGFTVDPLLIFALMRQESGFHTTAISPSGALGLMQLMPQTASLMQKKMNLDLTAVSNFVSNFSDPGVNITLGQNYVQDLLRNNLVDNNLVYLLAAYNAGPGRLQEWKKINLGHNDPLMFVESIPLPETRHYVMQVMTNYWIYSELAGATNHSAFALAKGKWPSYGGFQGPVAADQKPATPGGA